MTFLIAVVPPGLYMEFIDGLATWEPIRPVLILTEHGPMVMGRIEEC